MVAVRLVFFRLVELEGVFDLVGVFFFEDAAVVDHSAEAPGGVGAAAETKQVDLITGFIVVDDKPITVHHVFFQPLPESAAGDFVVVGTDAPVVKHNLFHAMAVCGTNGPGELQDVGGEIVADVFFGPVPCAVKTNCNPFQFIDLLSHPCSQRPAKLVSSRNFSQFFIDLLKSLRWG